MVGGIINTGNEMNFLSWEIPIFKMSSQYVIIPVQYFLPKWMSATATRMGKIGKHNPVRNAPVFRALSSALHLSVSPLGHVKST